MGSALRCCADIRVSPRRLRAGATTSDIRLMRRTVGAGIGVKAAGGIRTLADAPALIEAGVNRIGASASVAILSEA